MWCTITTRFSKIAIYRHKHWETLHIVGLEIFNFKGHEEVSTLLSFRTLYVDNAHVLEFQTDGKLSGLAAPGNHDHGGGCPSLDDLQVSKLWPDFSAADTIVDIITYSRNAVCSEMHSLVGSLNARTFLINDF